MRIDAAFAFLSGLTLVGGLALAAGVYWIHATLGLVNAAFLIISIPML